MKTDIPFDGLASILSHYELGNLKAAKLFETGTVQTNLLITTDRIQAVFRLYENRTDEDIPFELSVLQHLVHQGYPCPAPIAARSGKFIGHYEGKPYVLYTFMDGQHSDAKDHHLEVAAIIAKLHVLSEGWSPDVIRIGSHYGKVACLDAAIGNLARLSDTNEARVRRDWIEQELSAICLPDSLPQGIVHADPNPTNFLYSGNKIRAVLDFEMASYTHHIYDLGAVLYWWMGPYENTGSYVRAREAVRAYEVVRPLTEDERHHIFDALKMVMMMSAGWFARSDDFKQECQPVRLLNSIGRDGFYQRIFKAE